jgi:hypothetical protein
VHLYCRCIRFSIEEESRKEREEGDLVVGEGGSYTESVGMETGLRVNGVYLGGVVFPYVAL